MPRQNNSQKTQRWSFAPKGNFSQWPQRTREELERLCLDMPYAPAIPPQWRRISPTQYLRERASAVVLLPVKTKNGHELLRFAMKPGRSAQPLRKIREPLVA